MTTDRPNMPNESMRHLDEDTISDLAEERLGGEDQAAATNHLAVCPQCREEVAWIRTLRERIRELPEEHEPPHGAWQAIEERIRSGSRPPLGELRVRPATDRRAGQAPVGTGGQTAVGMAGQTAGQAAEGTAPRTASRQIPLWRLAAVLVLMALPAAATWLIMQPAQEDNADSLAGVEQPAGAGSVESDLRFAAETPAMVAEAYEPTIRQLRAILEANREQLQPGTIEILEENLRIIDAAIEDFYAALEADPANIDTVLLLNGMYETKVQLLRQATRLTREA